ncbi:MAG TPA: hypothetical protein VFQ37_16690 [Mycobacterium sp.]|nr:hypothetical protein [Mycobacterium sp.]
MAAAAALFPKEAEPYRYITTSPDAHVTEEPCEACDRLGRFHPRLDPFGNDQVRRFTDRVQVEGPQWRVEVGPGYVGVRNSDPARRQRRDEREVEERAGRVALLRFHACVETVARIEGRERRSPDASIRSWSRRSRSRMVERLGQLDFAPMFAAGRAPVMVTLTYPGDWLTVAPGPGECHRHLLALRKRWERKYGGPLFAVWKREFQRRGAPHYHLLVVPPEDAGFREWLSGAWASIVAHPDAGQRELHRLAGTGVDAVEGGRMSDPRRIGVYFSKHGSFAAKDYQNNAPEEWEGQSVGRFWGYWHLERVVRSVEVAPDVARAAARTARRWAAANSYNARVRVWRQRWDTDTGELLGGRWRHSTVRVRRFSRASGYLVVNDGAAFASQLAAASALAVAPPRRGRLVRGFLP